MNSMLLGQSIVTVGNIYVEDLFKWFHDRIFEDGGDGTGAIVCGNYVQAAEYFLAWYKEKYSSSPPPIGEETKDSIVYHGTDINENYIFTNDYNIRLFPGDYIFIIRHPCSSAGKEHILLEPIREYRC